MTNDCKTCPVSTGTHKPAEALQQIAEPQPEALRLADALTVPECTLEYGDCMKAGELLRAQHARIAELEGQLDAIGAGGVESLRKQAAAQQAVPASVIAGAVFDFAGYLTTLPHKEAIHCSEAHEAAPMVEAITEWCKRRNLTTDGAKVETWRDHLAEAPAHPAEGVPAQAVAVADARSARQIADAIVENFKDVGWSTSSIDDARVLEAVSAAIGEHGATEPLTGVASDVDSMARVLMAAFSKAEPEHPITRYPTSFVATFADMARAAIAAAQLADGVPAQSYVADFFREKGFYPSPAQAFAAGVAFAATQPAAQGMDADGMYYLQDARHHAMVGNCPSFWRPDGNGYTTNLDEAARFTFEDAMQQHQRRKTDLPWLCSEVDKLRRPTVDCQDMPRSWDAQRAALAAQAKQGGA